MLLLLLYQSLCLRPFALATKSFHFDFFAPSTKSSSHNLTFNRLFFEQKKMRMEKRKCPQMWYNTKSNKKRCNNKLQTHIRRRRKKWIEGKMRLSSAFQAAQIIDPSSFHFYWPENSNTNNNKKLLCSISFQFEWNTNHEWWERAISVPNQTES